jgi:hypothetical protein
MPGIVGVLAGRLGTRSQPQQQVMQPVNRLHGGRGIIHRRRQRLFCDVDQLPGAKGRIMVHGALAAAIDVTEQLVSRDWAGAAYLEDRRAALSDEVTHRRPHPDHAVPAHGEAHERLDIDAADHAAGCPSTMT